MVKTSAVCPFKPQSSDDISHNIEEYVEINRVNSDINESNIISHPHSRIALQQKKQKEEEEEFKKLKHLLQSSRQHQVNNDKADNVVVNQDIEVLNVSKLSIGDIVSVSSKSFSSSTELVKDDHSVSAIVVEKYNKSNKIGVGLLYNNSTNTYLQYTNVYVPKCDIIAISDNCPPLDDYCFICGENVGELTVCDCCYAYHPACLPQQYNKNIIHDPSNWECPRCCQDAVQISDKFSGEVDTSFVFKCLTDLIYAAGHAATGHNDQAKLTFLPKYPMMIRYSLLEMLCLEKNIDIQAKLTAWQQSTNHDDDAAASPPATPATATNHDDDAAASPPATPADATNPDDDAAASPAEAMCMPIRPKRGMIQIQMIPF